MDELSGLNPTFLIDMMKTRMPYGKYEGRFIHQIPSHYLEWMSRQSWPAGKLGQYLATMYEIRINGLEDILKPLMRFL